MAKFKPDLKALQNGVKDADKGADQGAGGLDLTRSLVGVVTVSARDKAPLASVTRGRVSDERCSIDWRH